MGAVKEAIYVENSPLESAFARLERAVERYAHNLEEQARSQLNTVLKSEVESLKDELKNLHDKGNESKGEISNLSAELVRFKNENKKLKENNLRIAQLLRKSISEMETLVG